MKENFRQNLAIQQKWIKISYPILDLRRSVQLFQVYIQYTRRKAARILVIVQYCKHIYEKRISHRKNFEKKTPRIYTIIASIDAKL